MNRNIGFLIDEWTMVEERSKKPKNIDKMTFQVDIGFGKEEWVNDFPDRDWERMICNVKNGYARYRYKLTE